jgi:ABC-type branched-subunit amino acid transport system substrate-binding protein
VRRAIDEVLSHRATDEAIDGPARTFLLALLDVAEQSGSASDHALKATLAPGKANHVLNEWLARGKDAVPTIKVGLLHSRTGAMAISEIPVARATRLAVERINATGGVRGRRIEIVEEDGASRADEFANVAHRLLDAGVVAIFGCWTSASRMEVIKVLETRGGLLFYPLQYEGYERNDHVLYFGAAPNQQLLPALDWCIEDGARRFLMVRSDYVFPMSRTRSWSDISERRQSGE